MNTKAQATERLVVASERIKNARAEHKAALKASLDASTQYQAAQAHPTCAAKLHEMKLARGATEKRVEVAAVAIEQAQQEFASRLREFKSTLTDDNRPPLVAKQVSDPRGEVLRLMTS